MAVILAIIAIVMGVTYLDNYIAYDSHCYEVAATRAMYIDELEKYDEMRDSDVTASSTYLELREKVIDFNGEIEYAKSLNPFLVLGNILCVQFFRLKDLKVMVLVRLFIFSFRKETSDR